MNALDLTGVGKRYWQMEEQAMLLKALIPRRVKRSERWALRNIDLQVDAGETLGVLGQNGAGKTTLLRLLAGVTEPTEGSVTIRGRVAPMIGVGVGFHHEMSGRENVYVSGMLLGLTRDEIDDRFDKIVAFAELADFIDTPVKFYSTGMFMRLGFSVSVHVDPRVLLIDEVLAVGDVAFQLKCFDRMRELREAGTTIVVVSHSMAAIQVLCPRAIVIRHGNLEFDGPVDDAIGTHLQLLDTESDHSGTYLHDRPSRGIVHVEHQELRGASGTATTVVHQDDALTLRAELTFDEDVDSPLLVFIARDETGRVIYGAQSAFGASNRLMVAGQRATIEVPFQPRFGGGTYRVELVIADSHGHDVLGRSEGPSMLFVGPRPGAFGIADLAARILVDGQPVDDHQSLAL